jgi:hypothetical protein
VLRGPRLLTLLALALPLLPETQATASAAAVFCFVRVSISGQCLLELFGVAFQRLELLALALQNAKELFDLNLLRERDAAEMLDVRLTSQVHSASGSCRSVERKRFRLQRPPGDGVRRPTSSQPSMKSASSLAVTCATPSRARAPRSARARDASEKCTRRCHPIRTPCSPATLVEKEEIAAQRASPLFTSPNRPS